MKTVCQMLQDGYFSPLKTELRQLKKEMSLINRRDQILTSMVDLRDSARYNKETDLVMDFILENESMISEQSENSDLIENED